MLTAIMLLAALGLAPVIGGWQGELNNGILQILVFTGLLISFAHAKTRERVNISAPGALAFIIFLFICVVSAIFSKYTYLNLKYLLFASACTGAYILAFSLCRDLKTAAAAVWTLALSALGVCIYGIRNYAIMTGGGSEFWSSLTSSGTHPRLSSTFINPGFFAGFLVIAIPVTLAVYLVTRKKSLAVLSGMALVTEIIALILTGTKFAVIASVFSMLAFFILAVWTKSIKAAQVKRFALITIVLIPLVMVFRAPLTSRISEAESGGTQVHSTVFRPYTWKGTLAMVKSNPVLGVGPGAFEAAYPRYELAGPTKNAHQSYLQIASETGILGITSFLAGLLAIALHSLKGIIRWRQPSESTPQSESITWEDLVPQNMWRLICCGIFAGLAGSALRSLADSDWYVIGIAIPFFTLAGVLAARSANTANQPALIKPAQIMLAFVCIVFTTISLSFALGDLIAPKDGLIQGSPGAIAQRYRLAHRFSPLNPKYAREEAKCLLADGDMDGALKAAETAVNLGRWESENNNVRALIAVQEGDYKTAETYFNHALTCNPNSTQTLFQLASAYREQGNMKKFEDTLKRLLKIENSSYEKIKGAPEIVDTTYAFAHTYFGEKYMEEKKYKEALAEFEASANRLEQWRSNKDVIAMFRATGWLSKEQENILLEFLKDSHLRVADAYDALGDKANAASSRAKANKIKLR